MLPEAWSTLRRGRAWSAVSPTGLSCEALEREEARRRRRTIRQWATVVGVNAVAVVALFFAGGEGLVRALSESVRRAERLNGEKALLSVQVERLEAIHGYSGRYGIPADVATSIYDIALAEGLEPELAFRLVEIESSFRRRAVSPKGAIGYTQIKPSTARSLDPTVSEADLFDPEVNLRLGFRYLSELLGQYDGDLRLALLAYNRGPSRVQDLMAVGEDPANGYARGVMGED